VLLLLDLRFEWWNALLLFTLWLAQFVFPAWRTIDEAAYAAWALALVATWPWNPPAAPRAFWRLLRRERGFAR
jgi:hypothetical protein